MHPVIKNLYEDYRMAYKAYLDAVEREFSKSGVFSAHGTYEKHQLEVLHNSLQEVWHFEKAKNRITVEIGS